MLFRSSVPIAAGHDCDDLTWLARRIVYTTPTEYPSQMVADQSYAIFFKIGTLDRLQSWIKNPEGTLIQRNYRKLKDLIDRDIFSHYTDVAAGNWTSMFLFLSTVSNYKHNILSASSLLLAPALLGFEQPHSTRD